MRTHKPTSKAGEQHIKPFKPNHKAKIKEALERLRIGGTHEEISVVATMRPDQVWKRLSEMEKEGTIFNTGISRKLRSGVGGIVWQLAGEKVFEQTEYPRTKKERKANNTLKQLDLLKQSTLF